MFAGKKSAQIRETLISESAWEEMTCLFAPSLKQVAIQIVQNQFDRDTAEKKLAELIQKLEFDITAAELSAYLFKPGNA
ncbi:TPA: hypothetical protein MIG70_26475 [Klebsiella pneumoniae]|nr:hypothetical protein [Klebsiella pneumoniae]